MFYTHVRRSMYKDVVQLGTSLNKPQIMYSFPLKLAAILLAFLRGK